MSPVLGSPLDRVDGRAKVTGAATFAADQRPPDLTYAALVTSTIARGRIVGMDLAAASSAPGVVLIVTADNAPEITPPAMPPWPFGQSFVPLQDHVVRHGGQIVAIVVADSLERAHDAASMVRVDYADDTPRVSLDEYLDAAITPASGEGVEYSYRRGDVDAGLAEAPVVLDANFSTSMQHHNPMEPSATTAHWDGECLTLFEATQSVGWSRQQVATMIGVPTDNVRVVSPYLGGGFGCKGYVWPHTPLTAAVARQVGRPVKLVLTRAQMYSLHGHRAETRQHLRVGADHRGRLIAMSHDAVAQTSTFNDICWEETSGTAYLYACENVSVDRRVVRLDLGNPTPMRAPSGVGGFALETMLDELSYAVGVDPIEMRLRNYSDADPQTEIPWGSGKFLRECYERGAAQFGWQRPRPKPRTMLQEGRLVGWGMATAFHPVYKSAAEVEVTVDQDGLVLLRSATQDIGTGVRTVVTQVAAQVLGIDPGRIRFELGDTDFPPGAPSAGSRTAVSVGGATHTTCVQLRNALIEQAVGDPRSPLYGTAPTDISVLDGRLLSRRDPRRSESYVEVMSRRGRAVSARGAVTGQSSGHSYGAVFAEVRVDPSTGEVRVTRLTGVFDAGRILNPKTAASQASGGMIWGLGTALTEHTVVDGATGRILNANLSGYLVPVSADVPRIEVAFINEPDPSAGPLGARGNGELSPNGTTAAIGNAIFHATGRRIRQLPITPDKLIGSE